LGSGTTDEPAELGGGHSPSFRPQTGGGGPESGGGGGAALLAGLGELKAAVKEPLSKRLAPLW